MIKKKVIGSLLCGLMLSNIAIVNASAVSEISPLNIKWQHSIVGNKDDFLYDTVKTNEGGTISVGMFSSSNIEGIVNKGSYDATISKYDRNGNQEWIKSIGGSKDDNFGEVVKLKDNSLIAIGHSNSTDISGIANKGGYDILIAKYDENGNELWSKNWGGNNDDFSGTAISTNDGGFAIVGDTKSTNITGITNKGLTDAFIVKFNSNGEEEWVKSFGGNNDDDFVNIINTSDNGYLIIGDSNSTNLENIQNKGDVDGIIAKYDDKGNQQWVKSWGGNDRDGLQCIIEMENGSYILSGYTFSTNIDNVTPLTDEFKTVVYSYDNLGNSKLIKTFDKIDFLKFLKTSNNEIIALAVNYDNEYSCPMSTDLLKFDKNFNEIYRQNITDFFACDVTLMNDDTVLLNGTTLSEISNATLGKYVYPVKILNKTDTLDLQVVADNSLEMSLSTNQISFKGYNGVADLTNNDLNITVTSGLYYDLYATLNDDLRGSNDTQATIDKINLGIKTLEDVDYKNFVNVGEPLKLVENHINGRNINHNINLKLKGDSSVKADTYSTTITFETIQK